MLIMDTSTGVRMRIITEAMWLSSRSPALPTKGEGVGRCEWHNLAPAEMGTSTLVGEAGRGDRHA